MTTRVVGRPHVDDLVAQHWITILFKHMTDLDTLCVNDRTTDEDDVWVLKSAQYPQNRCRMTGASCWHHCALKLSQRPSLHEMMQSESRQNCRCLTKRLSAWQAPTCRESSARLFDRSYVTDAHAWIYVCEFVSKTLAVLMVAGNDSSVPRRALSQAYAQSPELWPLGSTGIRTIRDT